MLRPALLAALAVAGLAPRAAAQGRVDFDRQVRPIFAAHCASCHGPAKQRGGLRLDRRADALKGGDSGAVILPKRAADSPLAQLVAGKDADRVMPPDGPRLSAADVATLRAWIEQGADWPDDGSPAGAADWWSFRPLAKPPVPQPRIPNSDLRNPVDAFVLAQLAEKGLTPAPEADRRTLARRLHFDLIGLPPTPEQIDAFATDGSPDAYGRLVERLLASPQYGERWARHWLDVAHFGESHGYDKDKPRPNAWPYRDYVIRAFNADTPYARFVQEQIAGDVLFPGTVDGIEALGFLAAGPWDFIGHVELPETKIDGKIARHLDRDDVVSNVVGTFTGLTVHCAQCHNHKFDPIAQEDYYALHAVFAAIDRTDRAFDPDPPVAAKRAALEARKAAAAAKLAAADAAAREAAGEGFAEVARQRAEAEAERGAAERALRDLGPPRIVYVGTVHTGRDSFAGTGASGGKPRAIHVLPRGDVTRPGKEVGPGAIAAVPGLNGRFDLPPGHAEGERRAALARWLTDRDNPLTWRVIVNRVWQYHFGRGIVDTPNDFGRMGQPPTHPELLDWLAADFRDSGQSLKRLHRLIVTSAAYRRASASTPANETADADNRYLWRQQRRKLEAEAVRDAILSVAGKLDLRMGGPSFRDFAIDKPEHSPHYQYHLHDPDDPKSHRRAVYRFIVRSKPQPLMAALDCADPSLAVEKRNQSVSPQQALALFNGRLSLAMAGHFAARVERLAGDDTGRVAAAFRLALGRDPSAAERDALAAYAKDHGLANACRVVLNLNEFAFVD